MEHGTTASATSCARDLGILSIVIVVFIMEKEIRFFWWLFLFHLRPIEECDVEVLVAPIFRCDARAFPPLRKHAEPRRRFVVLRRKSSTALSRHTDSAKNCMACFKSCWIEMCCKKSSRVLAGPVPLIALGPPATVMPVVVTTVEIVPMKRIPSILLRRRIHHVPNLRVMPRCAASVEGGPSQNGNETSQASRGSRPFLLVVIQPSSQCPRREPRLEDMRQPCHQVVRDHPVVPSKQVAQQCLERGHPVAQGLCVLFVHSWLHHASLLQRRVKNRSLGSSNFQPRALKTEVKFPSMSHACLCSLARALGCDKCGCASSSSSSSTSTDLSPATIDYRERGRVVGTSTRAVACAFTSEPQPSPTLQKHRSRAGVPK